MKRKYSSHLLGQILLKRKIITRDQLKTAVEIRQEDRDHEDVKLLGNILVELKYASEKDILAALDEQVKIYQRVQTRRRIVEKE